MNKMQIRLLLVLCFSFFFQSMAGLNFRFRHITVENGLSSNIVRCLIQDKRGFVWIGTEDGLNVYDGKIVKNFKNNRNTPYSLTNNYITKLCEGSNDNLWIGTDTGIFLYDYRSDRFEKFVLRTSKGIRITTEISNIVEDKQHNVWISTLGQGVFCYHATKKQLDQYLDSQDKDWNMVSYIFVDFQNIVWASTRSNTHNISIFNRSKKHFVSYLFKQNQEPVSIVGICGQGDHSIFVGTWHHGVIKLDKKTGKMTSYLSPRKGIKDGVDHIHSLVPFSDTILFVGSDDGLSVLDLQTGKHQLVTTDVLSSTSLSNRFVYPIMKDREGSVWVGTYYGGINYASSANTSFYEFVHSPYYNSIGGSVVGRFCEGTDGRIWIGTDDGGLNCYTPKTNHFSQFMPNAGVKNSLSYHNVHALCFDGDDLWVGTYTGGLNVLNTKSGKFKKYSNDPKDIHSLDDRSVYALFKDKESRMWLGSMKGIDLYDRRNDNFIRVKNLGVMTIDIKQDAQGCLWFATQGKGLFKYNPQTAKWRNYLQSENVRTLSSNYINNIYVDHNGVMWVAASEGLCKYNESTDDFSRINLDLPSNNICCIIGDRNNLWLTTGNGLVRYMPQGKGLNYQIFNQSDGLQSSQFIMNSGLKSRSGEIYIGSVNGFNSFDPLKIAINKKVPSIEFVGLDILNKPVKVSKKGILTQSLRYARKIELNHDDNVFSISYTALSFCNPEKNKYAYKLEGFDKDWNYVGNQTKATYTNLSPGTYIFRVKASNNDGVWNSVDKKICIVVHPPFYLTLPFKAAYLILICLVIYILFHSYHKRTERKHQQHLQELKQEKEKELYDSKIQFFTMIAHEIRTPVSLITVPVERLLTETLTDKMREQLSMVYRNGQRLLQLVNQLLDFRKVEEGLFVIRPVDYKIEDLLIDEYEHFRPLMKQNNIDFVFTSTEKDFYSAIDVEAIVKVVSNLLSNAMKFAKSRVEMSFAKIDEKNFNISVKNDGPGIEESEKEKIFKPFYQIAQSNKYAGTGIGLSIVKELIEAHGGKVQVDSSAGQGCCFVVTLPIKHIKEDEVTEEPTVLSEEQIEEMDEEATDKPYLLVVDDNQDMLNMLKQSLESKYQVIAVTQAEEGLKALKKHEISLVISDLMMPGMDGFDFCKQVRLDELTAHIPIIMLTARTDVQSKVDAMKNHVDAFIEKPFSIKFLLAQIENLLITRSSLKQKFTETPFVSLKTIAANNPDLQLLNKLNHLIEENIPNENFKIEQLAEDLCISRSGLFAKVKELTGSTPNELLQNIRLRKSAELLMLKKYRINEIITLVGFGNSSYFTKCFQKKYGVKPSEYSKQRELTDNGKEKL